jgi:hypothetical protein
MCQSPIPAESISMASGLSARATSWRKTASAVGLRQIFPRQTNNTRTHSPHSTAQHSTAQHSTAAGVAADDVEIAWATPTL